MKKIIVLVLMLIVSGCAKEKLMPNIVGKNINELDVIKEEYKIDFNNTFIHDDNIEENIIISQSVLENASLKDVKTVDLTVSKGKRDLSLLKTDAINELGKIPVMMYHGIVDITNAEKKNDYPGGNVDKDGYNRTAESFKEDLEFYYQNNYEMIRLIDYVNMNISTSYGKSPIVLTFDDGNENNLKVTGLDDNGNIIIDPNSAVGILEDFKKRYPDYNVTATFFVNDSLFNQKEYNEKILNWLVDNGYDVGNHSMNHANFKNISQEKSVAEIGGIYNLLDTIIPGKYVKIIALPYGSPYNKSHANFASIMGGTFEGKEYKTLATLRVGWEPDYSCFNENFDPEFIKRVRAWDNNGVEFDIQMVFKMLEKSRYISDGDAKTIVTASKNKDIIKNTDKEVILYD